MSRFAALLAASTRELDFGPVQFRVRGVSPRLLAEHQRFQLLLIGTPDAETRGAMENIERLRGEGVDEAQLTQAQQAIFLDLARRKLSPGLQAQEEETTMNLLAAGVTHWRATGEDWRPCSIVAAGELVEGIDGAPDGIPVSALPGAAGAAELLKKAILDLSGVSDEAVKRVQAFRGAAGAAEAAASGGEGVQPPPE